MRFVLIDRITHYEKNVSLKGIKTLSLAEEYLKDHFPKKPILPGVLMLEALVQASAWLVRLSDDFKDSMITLGAAKTVRYGKFVSPGDTLEIETTLKKDEGETAEFVAKGTVNGEQVVSARLKLNRKNLVDVDAKLAKQDEQIKNYFRELSRQIRVEQAALV